MTQINKIVAEKSDEDYLYTDITSKIIEAFYIVYNKLGYGFLEKVYENAMMIELKKMGLSAFNQVPVIVHYDNFVVGEYCSDILVENKIIVELKTAEKLAVENEYQLINYLKATDKEVGLLLNFGKKPEIKRKVFSNSKKNLRES